MYAFILLKLCLVRDNTEFFAKLNLQIVNLSATSSANIVLHLYLSYLTLDFEKILTIGR